MGQSLSCTRHVVVLLLPTIRAMLDYVQCLNNTTTWSGANDGLFYNPTQRKAIQLHSNLILASNLRSLVHSRVPPSLLYKCIPLVFAIQKRRRQSPFTKLFLVHLACGGTVFFQVSPKVTELLVSANREI